MNEKLRSKKGSLEDIDALITCAIMSFRRDALERFETLTDFSKNVVCSQLLLLVNWFREVGSRFRGVVLHINIFLQLINAFSDQPTPEYKRKVAFRLEVVQMTQ